VNNKMNYNIYTDKPINLPNICFRCQSETCKAIHMDIKEQESIFIALAGLFSHIIALKDLGKSIKIPLCSHCFKKLIGIRLLVLFIFLIAVLAFVIGLNNKAGDLGLYLFVAGLFLGLLCPFIHLFLKEIVLGIEVSKNGQTYCYSFNSGDYPEYLKKHEIIDDYEITY